MKNDQIPHYRFIEVSFDHHCEIVKLPDVVPADSDSTFFVKNDVIMIASVPAANEEHARDLLRYLRQEMAQRYMDQAARFAEGD